MSFLFQFLTFSIVFGVVYTTTGESQPVLWQNLSNFALKWSKDFSDQNKPILLDLLNNSANVSQSCRISLILTLDGISKFEDWSILMINSWGKFPPSGLFEGSLTDFGSYDQCLSIFDNEVIGSAQYCSVNFSPVIPRPMSKQHNLYHKIPNLLPQEVYRNKSNPLIRIADDSSIFYWVSLRTAVCTPSKCTVDDIESLAKTVSNKLGLVLKSVKCETKTEFTLSGIQLFAIVVILVFIILCISGTIFDFNTDFEKNSNGFIFVRIFSLRKTINRLVAPTTTKDLCCIHGIRLLSILWILYGHTIQWSNFQLYSGSFFGKELLTVFLSQPLLNGEYGVVTFLLISGILTTYISLSMTRGDMKNFRLSFFILFRATRLLPQLMILILLTFLLPLMGSGPIWDEVVGKNVRNCENNWWLNLFLIQNLYKSDQMCALHTWFIALDYQFHIMTALLILVFLLNFKFGVILNIFSIIVFLILSILMVYVYELPPALINTGRTEHFERYFSSLHKKPISYGSVYFFGTLFGYFLYKRRTLNLKQPFLSIVWTVIMIAFCIPLWDKVPWNYGRPYTPLISTIVYNSTQMIWTVCTSAMIWLCITGNGQLINRFLSHKLFIPLARLTYSVYLCHALLIWYFIGSRRHLMDTSMYNVLINFLHIFLMSYLIGFVFYVVFESPILEFQKCLIESMKRKNMKNTVNEVEIKLNSKTNNTNNNV